MKLNEVIWKLNEVIIYEIEHILWSTLSLMQVFIFIKNGIYFRDVNFKDYHNNGFD